MSDLGRGPIESQEQALMAENPRMSDTGMWLGQKGCRFIGQPHPLSPYPLHPVGRAPLGKGISWVSKAQDLGPMVISPDLKAMLLPVS